MPDGIGSGKSDLFDSINQFFDLALLLDDQTALPYRDL